MTYPTAARSQGFTLTALLEGEWRQPRRLRL